MSNNISVPTRLPGCWRSNKNMSGEQNKERRFTLKGASSLVVLNKSLTLSHYQADGTWTRGDLPTCIPVQCDIPHNPLNGQ